MNDMFKPKKVIETQYSTAINRLMASLRQEVAKASTPTAILAVIKRFARSPTFRNATITVACSMVTHLLNSNARTWREAASKASKGRLIYEALRKELGQNTNTAKVYQGIINRNAKLIRTIPERAAQRVSKLASDGYAKGLRPEAITKDILKMFPGMTRSHAKLIARTESSKASTALTEARCDSAGIGWYVWRTSDDARVRSSHAHMDGVIIPWRDPPAPEVLIHKKSEGKYHAGDIYNCRCYPEALIRYDQVRWPAKVYTNGRIQYMTLAKFKKMTGGEL